MYCGIIHAISVISAKVRIQCFAMCSLWIPVFACLLFCASHAIANDGRFDQMLQELLHEKLSDDTITFDIAMESKTKLEELRRKEDDIDNIQLVYFVPTSSSFRIKIKMLDGLAQEVSGRYTSYIELPVAIKSIRMGSIITASDVATTKTRLNKTTSDYITSTNAIIGMQAKKYLQVGAHIKQSDITLPHIMHDGDSVSLVYQNSHLKLKTLGTAMGSGAVGDTIKAKNSTTGVLVYGRVKSRDVIEVGSE